MPEDNTVRMEGVRIIFRNFRGEERRFNQPGERNFGVILPEDIAEAMQADGWNVKILKAREEDLEENPEAEGTPWLPVKVAYDRGRPPKIFMVVGDKLRLMKEETIELLDAVDIINVDMRVRPYHYSARGNEGIAAYVQTMYVTINEDPLDAKYSELEMQ